MTDEGKNNMIWLVQDYSELQLSCVEFIMYISYVKYLINYMAYWYSPMKISPNITLFKNKILGEGGFGIVYEGLIVDKNIPVAIKYIKNIESPDNQKLFRNQLDIMKFLQNKPHPNIIQLISYIQTGEQHYLVMELCDGKSLQKQINKKPISEFETFQYLDQIVEGCMALNNNGIVHRDLKLQNILLTKNKTIKVADLGTAKMVQPELVRGSIFTTTIGTPLNFPPNINKNQCYTSKCDVWCIGLMVYQMLTGEHIFQRVFSVQENRIEAALQKCFKQIQEKGRQILNGNYHPWFKNFIQNTIVAQQKHRQSLDMLKKKIDEAKKSKYFENAFVNKNDQVNPKKYPQQMNPYFDKVPKPKKITIVSENVIVNPQEARIQPLIYKDGEKTICQFRRWVDYVYEKGKLFIDMSKLNNQIPEGSQNNCHKFIIDILGMIIYRATIQRLQKQLKSNKIVLPSGIQVDPKLLQQEWATKLKDLINHYLTIIQELKKSYSLDLVNIAISKIYTQKYLQNYSYIHQSFKTGLQQIKKFVKNQNNIQQHNFQATFASFFKLVYAPEFQELNEQELDIYWAFLTLSNAEDDFNQSKFMENDVISSFYENFNKKNREQRLRDVRDLRRKLKIK